MKKMIKLNYLWAILLGVAVVTGCEDKNTDEDTYESPSAITSGTTIIETPSGLTGEVGEVVSSYSTLANSMSGYITNLSQLPAGATVVSDNKSTSITWTGTAGGITWWIEYSNDGITKTWKYYIQSATITTKTLVITMTELVSGLGGSITVSAAFTDGYSFSYIWEKDSSGTYTGTLAIGASWYMQITSNTDLQTGSLIVYEGAGTSGTKLVDITWNNGHGTWYVYTLDPSSGTF